jgi:hypothetical protein
VPWDAFSDAEAVVSDGGTIRTDVRLHLRDGGAGRSPSHPSNREVGIPASVTIPYSYGVPRPMYDIHIL